MKTDHIRLGKGLEVSEFRDGEGAPVEVWFEAEADNHAPGWATIGAADVPKLIEWLQDWLETQGEGTS